MALSLSMRQTHVCLVWFYVCGFYLFTEQYPSLDVDSADTRFVTVDAQNPSVDIVFVACKK